MERLYAVGHTCGYVHDNGHGATVDHTLADEDKIAFNLATIVERVIEKVHDRKLQSGDLDPELLQGNFDKIWEAVQQGLDQKAVGISFDDPDAEFINELKRNSKVFTAFKNHENINEIVNELSDSSGELRSFESFREKAIELNAKWNGNWLRSEFEEARASAQMAGKWRNIERRKDRFPFLQYRTAGDDRVRDSHRKLNGITKPVDDAFWDEFYPPNGWRCRCTVKQVAGDSTLRMKLAEGEGEDEVQDEFKTNSGKTGHIFSLKHPYYIGNEATQQQVTMALNRIDFSEYDSENWRKSFDDETGGYVVQHSSQEDQRAVNWRAGTKLAAESKRVELMKQPVDDEVPDALVNTGYFIVHRVTSIADVQVLQDEDLIVNKVIFLIEGDVDEEALQQAIEALELNKFILV